MSFKHVIFGICVTAAALTATVTTVSAAGSEAGLAVRPPTGTLVAAVSPAATVGAAAAAGTTGTAALFAQQAPSSFDDLPARTGTSEEALSASNLALLALAALLSVGLLMTRRGGRA